MCPYLVWFFSYWLTKFSGSKVLHGGSAHDRDLDLQINACSGRFSSSRVIQVWVPSIWLAGGIKSCWRGRSSLLYVG